MGVKRAPQPDSTATDIATCPACASAEQAVVFRTGTTEYFMCRVCDHVWTAAAPPSGAFEAWTSMAFRITRRMLLRQPQ
jgi:hypothetical protein